MKLAPVAVKVGAASAPAATLTYMATRAALLPPLASSIFVQPPGVEIAAVAAEAYTQAMRRSLALGAASNTGEMVARAAEATTPSAPVWAIFANSGAPSLYRQGHAVVVHVGLTGAQAAAGRRLEHGQDQREAHAQGAAHGHQLGQGSADRRVAQHVRPVVGLGRAGDVALFCPAGTRPLGVHAGRGQAAPDRGQGQAARAVDDAGGGWEAGPDGAGGGRRGGGGRGGVPSPLAEARVRRG